MDDSQERWTVAQWLALPTRTPRVPGSIPTWNAPIFPDQRLDANGDAPLRGNSERYFIEGTFGVPSNAVARKQYRGKRAVAPLVGLVRAKLRDSLLRSATDLANFLIFPEAVFHACCRINWLKYHRNEGTWKNMKIHGSNLCSTHRNSVDTATEVHGGYGGNTTATSGRALPHTRPYNHCRHCSPRSPLARTDGESRPRLYWDSRSHYWSLRSRPRCTTFRTPNLYSAVVSSSCNQKRREYYSKLIRRS